MEIAMGAIGPLLPKLGELLMGELTMEKKVRKGIESLVTELKLMHAVLSKVAKVPADQLDAGVKIWAGNVKELSYQMEDIVDAFMVRVEGGGEPANPKNRVKKIVKKVKRLFKNGKDLRSISGALEEVVGQAKQLAEQRQRYELVHDTGVGSSIDPRVMALYKDVTELVGIEDTRDELINMLMGGDDWLNHPLKTISIVGFGGLGKTTLAKAAYDKIRVHFNCDAFVSVSQNPDVKKVFKNILYELDKHKYAHIRNEEWEERHLIDELIEFLNGKRYLIIIDDIWSGEAWELIQCAFSKKSPGSRLITTTRIFSLSKACCSSEDNVVGKVLDISRFEVLRVLDLEGSHVSDVGYVGKLLHLRYLGLKGTHVKDLPMEIGKLHFLLTLDLRRTEIRALPVVQLRRLMCLYVDCVMKLPSGIGNLTSLEVLDNLGLSDADLHLVKELGHLTKLRVLRLYFYDLDESMGKALEESIGNMDKLDNLRVHVPCRLRFHKELRQGLNTFCSPYQPSGSPVKTLIWACGTSLPCSKSWLRLSRWELAVRRWMKQRLRQGQRQRTTPTIPSLRYIDMQKRSFIQVDRCRRASLIRSFIQVSSTWIQSWVPPTTLNTTCMAPSESDVSKGKISRLSIRRSTAYVTTINNSKITNIVLHFSILAD
ncbi:hypothetical protein ZWY2020_026905 [Hordeum vulgare]|nr:hypothetical protein ZWY2020_026905 [Hordeum vulgare]